MATYTFHFTPFTVHMLKLCACINFNDNILSINQKKLAWDTTTPKQVLLKLSGDSNIGDLLRMALVFFKRADKNSLSLFESLYPYGYKNPGRKQSLQNPPDRKLVPTRNLRTREEPAPGGGIPGLPDAEKARGLDSHSGQGHRERHRD